MVYLLFSLRANVEIQPTVLAILFNCALPEAITLALQEIHADTALTSQLATDKIRLGAYANRLTPVAPDWSMAESTQPQPFRNDLDPEHYYTDFVTKWVRDFNVGIVGGCCGVTPAHIALLHDKLCEP